MELKNFMRKSQKIKSYDDKFRDFAHSLFLVSEDVGNTGDMINVIRKALFDNHLRIVEDVSDDNSER